MNLEKILKRMKRRWKEETSFKPLVYKLYCEGKPIPMKFESEQMEKDWRARGERKIYEKLGFKCKIRKEKPDRFQKKERKMFGRLTWWLEHITAG